MYKWLLHHACRAGSEAAASVLLAAGAEVNCQDDEGVTPLMLACGRNEWQLVSLLLERGGDPALRDAGGCTALMYAANHGPSSDGAEARQVMMKRGGQPVINARNNEGMSSSMLACRAKNGPLVLELLEGGADPCLRDARGCTALMYATARSHSRGDMAVLRALVHGGRAIDARNEEGRTALWLACRQGDTEKARVSE